MSSNQIRHVLLLIVCCFLFFVSFSSPNAAAADLVFEPLSKATPDSQGLSTDHLKKAVTKINNGEYGRIHSLLIARNNYLIMEEYFSGYERDDFHPVYSVTKSITSALIGIALKQGKINSLDTKLLEFFPEYEKIENLDQYKKKISLKNVLTMTAGFQWDESSIPWFDPLNDARKMSDSYDSIKYVLDLPMSGPPGIFVYNSGCSMLLSGVLKNTTGQSAEEYANDYLFKQIGIKKWRWAILSILSNRMTNTAWGLNLRPIDMARIGILFLNGGNWHKKQVIPKEWYQVSTKRHVIVKKRYAYGYQWWLILDNDHNFKDLSIKDAYFAWGRGGQFILVIPHLNMVVVSTAENYENSTVFFNVLSDHVFPAILD
jgi:CubicO group peptidase (beta-lactamase class C family)